MIKKIWLSKTDLECLNEGKEITINNEINIEVDEALKKGRISFKCFDSYLRKNTNGEHKEI